MAPTPVNLGETTLSRTTTMQEVTWEHIDIGIATRIVDRARWTSCKYDAAYNTDPGDWLPHGGALSSGKAVTAARLGGALSVRPTKTKAVIKQIPGKRGATLVFAPKGKD